MKNIILIIAAIAAGYAVGKRCVRPKQRRAAIPTTGGYWVHNYITGKFEWFPRDRISYIESLS